MNTLNAKRLLEMLVFDFQKSAGGIVSEHNRDMQLVWSTMRAGSLSSAFQAAASKGWLKPNLDSWEITQLGVEEAGKE